MLSNDEVMTCMAGKGGVHYLAAERKSGRNYCPFEYSTQGGTLKISAAFLVYQETTWWSYGGLVMPFGTTHQVASSLNK